MSLLHNDSIYSALRYIVRYHCSAYCVLSLFLCVAHVVLPVGSIEFTTISQVNGAVLQL